MKETDVAWLAGLLEGEGCFVVRPKNTPYIALKMNDKDVVEKAAALMKMTVTRPRNNYKTSFGIDKCYYIQVYNRDVLLDVIPRMMPYFGERRVKQATKLLNVVRRRKRAEADYLQMIILVRALHNKGISQRELSEITGRARTTTSKWIRESIPTVVQIRKYNWAEEGTLP